MCLCCKTEAQRNLTAEEKNKCGRQLVKSAKFPGFEFLIFTTINLCCGFNVFVFQIVSIVYKSPLWFIGAG